MPTFGRRSALGLRPRRSGPEAVAEHDFGQLSSIRRPAGRRVDHVSRLAEILWTYRCWCDHAQCLRLPAAIVVKAVNSAAWNTQRLPRPDVKWFSVDRPGQHSVETVNGLLVMVVAMRWHRQALPGR